MYERFTDRARKCLQLAQQEAQRLNHVYIGTEHVLIGVCKEGSGIGCSAMNRLGVNPQDVMCRCRYLLTSGLPLVSMGKLPMTPGAKGVIELAIKQDSDLQFNYVGSEHLLMGLVLQEDGVASGVLRGSGLTADGLRDMILRINGKQLESTPVVDAGIYKWAYSGTVIRYPYPQQTENAADTPVVVGETTSDEPTNNPAPMTEKSDLHNAARAIIEKITTFLRATAAFGLPSTEFQTCADVPVAVGGPPITPLPGNNPSEFMFTRMLCDLAAAASRGIVLACSVNRDAEDNWRWEFVVRQPPNHAKE